MGAWGGSPPRGPRRRECSATRQNGCFPKNAESSKPLPSFACRSHLCSTVSRIWLMFRQIRPNPLSSRSKSLRQANFGDGFEDSAFFRKMPVVDFVFSSNSLAAWALKEEDPPPVGGALVENASNTTAATTTTTTIRLRMRLRLVLLLLLLRRPRLLRSSICGATTRTPRTHPFCRSPRRHRNGGVALTPTGHSTLTSPSYSVTATTTGTRAITTTTTTAMPTRRRSSIRTITSTTSASGTARTGTTACTRTTPSTRLAEKGNSALVRAAVVVVVVVERVLVLVPALVLLLALV